MSEDTTTKSRVLYCPHCGNTSVQTVLVTQEYEEKLYAIPSGAVSQEPAIYTVVRCETCKELLVYSEMYEFAEQSETHFGDLAFPKQSAFSKAVPDRIKKTYHEAVKVKEISHMAFVVLARRTLEEICHEKDAKGKGLAEKLSYLAEQGDIPKTLAEASTLIRLVGNAGAHASDTEITILHVWAIDDFIKAIIEYLYIAPKKIEEFRLRFESFSKVPDEKA